MAAQGHTWDAHRDWQEERLSLPDLANTHSFSRWQTSTMNATPARLYDTSFSSPRPSALDGLVLMSSAFVR